MAKKRRKQKSARKPPKKESRGASYKKEPRGFPLKNHPILLVSMLLVILLALVFYQLVFEGKVFVSPDAVAPIGFATVAEESVKEGGPYPLWNPYVFLGMPSFGSLSYNPHVYYPDVILKAILTVLPFLPPMTWLLIYYFVAGLFVFLLLRDKNVSLEAGALAAVVFMLTPNLAAIGAFGHGSKLITCAFIPVVLLTAFRLLSRGGAIWFGLFALAAGTQLLRAHVQIVYYTWIALGLYGLLFLLVRSSFDLGFSKRLVRLGYLALALAVALALASVLYLPVHEYSAFSSRGGAVGGGMEFGRATDWSFSPIEMMTFLVPSWLGFGGPTYWGSMPFTDYPNYMGILPLFLALIALRGIRNREVLFSAALVFLSLLISFGKHLEPLYRALYEYLPYFNKFRVPVMILVLTQFGVAVLAAYGIEQIRRARERAGASSFYERAALGIAIAFLGVWVVWVAFGDSFESWYAGLVTSALQSRAAAAGAMGSFSLASAERVASECFAMVKRDVLFIGLLGAAGFACVYLFLRHKLSLAVLAAVLVCLTVADMWRVNARIVAPMVGERSSVSVDEFRDDTIEFFERDSSLYRILPLGADFQSNRYAAFGIANVGGYHAAKPALYEKFHDAIIRPRKLTPGVLAMLNVKYVVAPTRFQSGPLLNLVHDGSKKVYEFRGVLPRAYLVDSVKVLPDEAAVLEELVSPQFDYLTTALLLETLPVKPVTRQGSSVSIKEYGLNRIDIDASIADTCFLVLSELHYPDWKAEIDGVAAKIYRTNFVLRGMPLEPGKHSITFFYDSRSLRTGMILSASASVVIILSLIPAAVSQLRRGKRSEGARNSPDV